MLSISFAVRRVRRPVRAGLLVIAALPALVAAARSSSLSIDRTRVYLSRGHQSELITLTNQSGDAVRLQVTAHRWKQVPGEPIRLEPTEDVIFFPALMTIEPGQSRPIRVGLARGPDDQERAYRIIIEELPPPTRAAAMQLTVLTRLSVPVFVQPQKPEPRLSVESLVTTPDGIGVTIVNRGSAHVMVDQVALHGRDRNDRTTGRGEAAGWYVLAGSTQTFNVPMASPCSSVTAFEVALKSGETVSRHTVPGSSICQP